MTWQHSLVVASNQLASRSRRPFNQSAMVFWVGLNADLGGMLQEPVLAILQFLAAFVGKRLGVFVMVPMGRLTGQEAWTIGIGLNARLTTEIIVAQLLFSAKLIDVHLFTALITASAVSTISVPSLFTLLVRKRGDELRTIKSAASTKEKSHAE